MLECEAAAEVLVNRSRATLLDDMWGPIGCFFVEEASHWMSCLDSAMIAVLLCAGIEALLQPKGDRWEPVQLG